MGNSTNTTPFNNSDIFNLQSLLLLDGLVRISKIGQIRWSNQFRTMTAGIRPQETSGYHDIQMPADGVAIPVSDGTTRLVAPQVAGDVFNTGGIPLNAWESLWYRIPTGTNNVSVPANFRIQRYQDASNTVNGLLSPNIVGVSADEWVLIATRDAANNFRLGTGDSVSIYGAVGVSNDNMVANWTAMKNRASGNGYFFSPGGNTRLPTAFGFTGIIRWINGGLHNYTNRNGFVDVTQTQKPAGTTVFVAGGTSRTWRLMTALEKREWFGGATRGTDAISSTTTVVDLLTNEILCWVPDLTSTQSAGSWYIFGNNLNFDLPIHALPIASRQSTGANDTIQILVGGVQQALRSNDAIYMSIGSEDAIDRSKRKVTHKGVKHCRWTPTNFFSGTAANGLLGRSDGLLVSWDDNTLIWGISDGYASWGNKYQYIDVPVVGAAIPVVIANSSITRVVQNIGGKRFVPLSIWEALYFIPPANSTGGTSVSGDFVIGYYNAPHNIPRGAVLVAKFESTVTIGNAGTTINKNRVLFADGTYIQPGVARPTSIAVSTLYDSSHNSGEWRNITVAGSTPPGGSAILPAVTGVTGNYPAPYNAQFRNLTLNDDPRGAFELKGLIQLNTNITAISGVIGFIPGVQVYGSPIYMVPIVASITTDSKLIPAEIRLVNATLGNQTGVNIVAYASSFNSAVNPYFTLGINGGTSLAGNSMWVSLDNIGVVPHA